MVLVLTSTNYQDGQSSLPSFDAQIPLKSVEVRGEMIDFVGRVKVTQTFINNYPHNIEAKYLFNLTEDSTVVGMTMQIGDRVLVSHVEEKTEARETYETAINEKKTTCLLEKSAANGIYTVQVGNILQGQEIKIAIEYLTQLECSDEGHIRFVLPTNISPKYDAAQKSIVDMMEKRNTMEALKHVSHVPFTFKLELVWKSNNQIKEVKSLTNDISVSGIDDRTVRVVCETAPRNGDFNILVTTDVTPTLYVSQQGADSFLMINHRIKDEVLDIVGGEYIIMVDRSGSMGDSFSNWSGSDGRAENNKKKIDYAREATKLFVQSLPAGSSFNVVSFGSSYESLFPSSVEYNETTSQQALKQIAEFQANMGDTELYQCLSDVLSGQKNRSQIATAAVDDSNATASANSNSNSNSKKKRSWKANIGSTELFQCLSNVLSGQCNSNSDQVIDPSKRRSMSSDTGSINTSASTKKSTEKIVILMTDGDVGNVDSVVSLIKQYNYNSRVFTIGIGQDVNRFLCEKVASASNAYSEIVVDNPNISMVVAKMLDAATKSYYNHSTLILPQGRRVEIDKAIYPNLFCTFFHKLPTTELTAMMSSTQSVSSRESMVIGLESVDGINQTKLKWRFPFVTSQLSQLMDSSIIPRLYAADLIRCLEKANDNHRHTREIVRVSCEYGIMNERTSFVMVDERENESIRGAPLQVTVPQVEVGDGSFRTTQADMFQARNGFSALSSNEKGATIGYSSKTFLPVPIGPTSSAVIYPTLPLPTNKTYHVFISHAWALDGEGRDNHQRVKRLNDILKKRGIVTWFDDDRIRQYTRSLRDILAKALDSACCVLICITKEYEEKVTKGDESDNCLYEFNAAAHCELASKRMTAVMEGSMLDPAAWGVRLKAELRGKLYTDLSSDVKFEENCEVIVQNIINMLQLP